MLGCLSLLITATSWCYLRRVIVTAADFDSEECAIVQIPPFVDGTERATADLGTPLPPLRLLWRWVK